MGSMFDFCNKLPEINLATFNTENVENFEAIFRQCLSVKSLDL